MGSGKIENTISFVQNFKISLYILQNEKSKNEIEFLKASNEVAILRKRLMTRLAFGTAGLRGVMQAGFNAMNDLVVIQSAQGLLQYVLSCFPDSKDRAKGIVLGYDGRYNSKRYFIVEFVSVYIAHIHNPFF